MNYITRDILSFYKDNNGFSNTEYLTKYFSDSGVFGDNKPYDNNVIDNKWNKIDTNIGTIDEHNTYEINSMGLRGEVYDNATRVGSGCSITFGIGVPEAGRWTNLLGNMTNKNIINLGNPGASIESICTDIIRYCVNNKMPEEIFCLFPDFFRSLVVVDKEFYKSHKQTKHNYYDKPEVIGDHLLLRYCNPRVNVYKDNIFMEIKDQKYIEDSRSPHQLILNSINFIYILESFCLTNNIKLYWTTWDLASFLIMEQLRNLKDFKLKNYTPFFPPHNRSHAGSFVNLTCRSSHESNFKDDLFWHMGTDYSIVNGKKTNEFSHPGVHFHTHVAEFFEKYV